MQISKWKSEKTNRFFLAFYILKVISLVSVTYKKHSEVSPEWKLHICKLLILSFLLSFSCAAILVINSASLSLSSLLTAFY